MGPKTNRDQERKLKSYHVRGIDLCNLGEESKPSNHTALIDHKADLNFR